ncbi:hypothetical protein CYLTODRAFT_458277 [Cylindrobasidium torrendii FP15055 ss-10]|uniref:Uncharacterized protein n=1 Tax=Cylindrobasidium torrendii FP15055 ss-10 TaxID=1314674 RepID=A0A0D7AY25_9AGAR|nr:hypothetical protein CYLTODRAFT_458277 [Cylindrobasidium torrendii FP15055 ss-10]
MDYRQPRYPPEVVDEPESSPSSSSSSGPSLPDYQSEQYRRRRYQSAPGKRPKRDAPQPRSRTEFNSLVHQLLPRARAPDATQTLRRELEIYESAYRVQSNLHEQLMDAKSTIAANESELNHAQREVERARRIIADIDQQRMAAEAQAEAARSQARRIALEQCFEDSSKAGYGLGYDEGYKLARVVHHTRLVIEDDDDEPRQAPTPARKRNSSLADSVLARYDQREEKLKPRIQPSPEVVAFRSATPAVKNARRATDVPRRPASTPPRPTTPPRAASTPPRIPQQETIIPRKADPWRAPSQNEPARLPSRSQSTHVPSRNEPVRVHTEPARPPSRSQSVRPPSRNESVRPPSRGRTPIPIYAPSEKSMDEKKPRFRAFSLSSKKTRFHGESPSPERVYTGPPQPVVPPVPFMPASPTKIYGPPRSSTGPPPAYPSQSPRSAPPVSFSMPKPIVVPTFPSEARGQESRPTTGMSTPYSQYEMLKPSTTPPAPSLSAPPARNPPTPTEQIAAEWRSRNSDVSNSPELLKPRANNIYAPRRSPSAPLPEPPPRNRPQPVMPAPLYKPPTPTQTQAPARSSSPLHRIPNPFTRTRSPLVERDIVQPTSLGAVVQDEKFKSPRGVLLEDIYRNPRNNARGLHQGSPNGEIPAVVVTHPASDSPRSSHTTTTIESSPPVRAKSPLQRLFGHLKRTWSSPGVNIEIEPPSRSPSDAHEPELNMSYLTPEGLSLRPLEEVDTVVDGENSSSSSSSSPHSDSDGSLTAVNTTRPPSTRPSSAMPVDTSNAYPASYVPESHNAFFSPILSLSESLHEEPPVPQPRVDGSGAPLYFYHTSTHETSDRTDSRSRGSSPSTRGRHSTSPPTSFTRPISLFSKDS